MRSVRPGNRDDIRRRRVVPFCPMRAYRPESSVHKDRDGSKATGRARSLPPSPCASFAATTTPYGLRYDVLDRLACRPWKQLFKFLLGLQRKCNLNEELKRGPAASFEQFERAETDLGAIGKAGLRQVCIKTPLSNARGQPGCHLIGRRN